MTIVSSAATAPTATSSFSCGSTRPLALTAPQTLYYLDNSRAFRVLWTAYELGVGERVHVKKFPRVQGKKAVPEMTSESGFSLGKSPFLVDDEGGDRVEVFESVACMEYLMERYGSASIELLPPMGKWAERTKVASYLSFCETLMLHSLAIIYAQWFTPAGNDEVLRPLTDTMSGIVCKDLDLLERTLEENKSAFGAENGLYLANGRFSAADIANAFSAEYSECLHPHVRCRRLIAPYCEAHVVAPIHSSPHQRRRYEWEEVAERGSMAEEDRAEASLPGYQEGCWIARLYSARAVRRPGLRFQRDVEEPPGCKRRSK